MNNNRDEAAISRCIESDIPETFGKKWADSFWRVRASLEEKYGETLESLLAFSIFYFDYTFDSIADEIDFDSEDWAYIFYNELSKKNKPANLLNGTPFSDFPSTGDILRAIAVIWFFDAALIYPDNPELAMDNLFEAAHALSLAHSEFMWGESEKCQREEQREVNSAKARDLNAIKHSDNNAVRLMVLTEWEKDISRFPSAEKAGKHYWQWLVDQGIEREPRTVIGWIRVHAKTIGVRFR